MSTNAIFIPFHVLFHLYSVFCIENSSRLVFFIFFRFNCFFLHTHICTMQRNIIINFIFKSFHKICVINSEGLFNQYLQEQWTVNKWSNEQKCVKKLITDQNIYKSISNNIISCRKNLSHIRKENMGVHTVVVSFLLGDNTLPYETSCIVITSTTLYCISFDKSTDRSHR